MGSRKIRLILAGVVATIVVVGVAGWWFFIRDDAPKKASIDDAGKTLEEEASDSDASSDAGLDGAWTIDSSIGSFDDFTGTYAGYRVEEQLANIGANTAVGRTPTVTGTMTITGNKVIEASFEVDMTTLQSDQGLRDNAMKSRGLQTETFPRASFVLTDPIDLPADVAPGQQLAFAAIGELTLHGVTKPLTLSLDAQLDGDTVAIVGNTPVVLADYAIEAPVGLSVVSIADNGLLEFQLFLTR